MKLLESVSYIFALLLLEKSFILGQQPSPETAKKSQSSERVADEKEGQSIVEMVQDLGEEREFELVPVKDITEVSGTGEIPYLLKYPKADSDKLDEEERETICRIGFDHVRENVHGIEFEYLEAGRIEKMKAYVIIDSFSEDLSDTAAVVPAYQCPTKPETYIHIGYGYDYGPYVDLANGEGPSNATGDRQDETEGGEENEPLYQVIYKIGRRIPTFKELLVYQLKLVEEIEEADVSVLTSVPLSSISPSLYDTNALSEAQRHQMCRRAIQVTPEVKVEFSNEEKTGMSKYYVLTIKSKRTSRNPMHYDVIMQMFACPCNPKLYVHVNGQERGHNLWAIMKEEEVEQSFAHDIMGYEILPVMSIEVYEGSLEIHNLTVEEEDSVERFILTRYKSNNWMKTTDSDPDVQEETTIAEDRKAELGDAGSERMEVDTTDRENIDEVRDTSMNEDELRNGLRELEVDEKDVSKFSRLLRRPSDDMEQKQYMVRRAKIDTDADLTERQRKDVCKRAIKAVSGREAVLTDEETGKSLFYEIKVERVRPRERNIVNAYQCPSEPIVWIHISRRESIESTVWVIVRGKKDLAYFTEQFKK